MGFMALNSAIFGRGEGAGRRGICTAMDLGALGFGQREEEEGEPRLGRSGSTRGPHGREGEVEGAGSGATAGRLGSGCRPARPTGRRGEGRGGPREKEKGEGGWTVGEKIGPRVFFFLEIPFLI